MQRSHYPEQAENKTLKKKEKKNTEILKKKHNQELKVDKLIQNRSWDFSKSKEEEKYLSMEFALV